MSQEEKFEELKKIMDRRASHHDTSLARRKAQTALIAKYPEEYATLLAKNGGKSPAKKVV
jgi:hypothetical protein